MLQYNTFCINDDELTSNDIIIPPRPTVIIVDFYGRY